MRRSRYFSAAVLLIVAALILASSGCFAESGSTGTPATAQPTVIKPKPTVTSVAATTSGTASAYFAILDIKVKNDGAEGTILVIGSVTQNGKTSQNEMPVYLKQGETHELKLTFPLVWRGGEWTSNVQTQVP